MLFARIYATAIYRCLNAICLESTCNTSNNLDVEYKQMYLTSFVYDVEQDQMSKRCEKKKSKFANLKCAVDHKG